MRAASTPMALACVGWLVATVATVGAGLGSAGCGSPRAALARPLAPKPVKVRAFTETSPVRLLASAGPYLFAAAGRGLDRWEVTSGAVLPLSIAQGLPGDRVIALAVDDARGRLWAITDRGIAFYDVERQSLGEVPAPPRGLGIDLAATDGHVLAAAAGGGGLWLGHRRGLAYVDAEGRWTATGVTEAVTALHLAEDGRLWIGTAAGLVGREPGGTSYRYGPEHGLAITQVREVTRGPGGGVLVLGEEPGGRPRLALRRGDAWTSYRVSPELRWSAAAPLGDDVVVLGAGGLYRIAARPPGARRPLSRDGWRLLAIAGELTAALPMIVDRIDARIPDGAAALAVHGGDIYVGTRDVGVARIPVGGSTALAWLRRAEMLTDATHLTVACVRKDDCLLATGAQRAWRWRGDGFESVGPEDQIVLAVVRGDGAVHAIHRAAVAERGEQLTVSRVDGAAWSTVAVLDTPGVLPGVSFARFAPDGRLWIGLRAHDGAGWQPWGVVSVSVSSGAIADRRPALDAGDGPGGDLDASVPVDVIDAAFRGEQLWLATGNGAIQVDGDTTTRWTQRDGLPAPRVRALVAAPGGAVMIATRAGVARFDGERWTSPPELAFPVNDLAVSRDGRLWLATARGIAVYDGRRVRRVDVRRGLLENEIGEIVVDDYGRLWARGARSLAVISP
jgi:hypothetical protein